MKLDTNIIHYSSCECALLKGFHGNGVKGSRSVSDGLGNLVNLIAPGLLNGFEPKLLP